MDPAGPIYRRIEFCRNPETLWGKLKSGRYDWLGVKPDGQFVLGSPKVGRITDSLSTTLLKGESSVGDHGVLTETVASPKPDATWYDTEAEARAGFDEQVKQLEDDAKAPRLVRVRLVVQGEPVADEFIVLRIATYQ